MALKRGSKKRYYGKKQGKGWKKRFFKLSLQKLSCISAQAKLHLGSSEAASRQKRSCISAKAKLHLGKSQAAYSTKAKQHIGNYRYKKNERDEKTYKEDLHGACPLSKHHYIGMWIGRERQKQGALQPVMLSLCGVA